MQQLHLNLTETVNKYRNHYALATCNKALMLLKSMTKSALHLGVIEEDICLPVKLFKLNNARTRFLNVYEVKRLINVCRDYSNKTIAGYIALLALTNSRKMLPTMSLKSYLRSLRGKLTRVAYHYGSIKNS